MTFTTIIIFITECVISRLYGLDVCKSSILLEYSILLQQICQHYFLTTMRQERNKWTWDQKSWVLILVSTVSSFTPPFWTSIFSPVKTGNWTWWSLNSLPVVNVSHRSLIFFCFQEKKEVLEEKCTCQLNLFCIT